MHPPGPEFTNNQRQEPSAGISTAAVHLGIVICLVAAMIGLLPRWLLVVGIPALLLYTWTSKSSPDRGPVEGLLVFNQDPAESDPDYYNR